MCSLDTSSLPWPISTTIGSQPANKLQNLKEDFLEKKLSRKRFSDLEDQIPITIFFANKRTQAFENPKKKKILEKKLFCMIFAKVFTNTRYVKYVDLNTPDLAIHAILA